MMAPKQATDEYGMPYNTLDALGRVSYMALLEGHPSYDGIRVCKALMPSYKVTGICIQDQDASGISLDGRTSPGQPTAVVEIISCDTCLSAHSRNFDPVEGNGGSALSIADLEERSDVLRGGGGGKREHRARMASLGHKAEKWLGNSRDCSRTMQGRYIKIIRPKCQTIS